MFTLRPYQEAAVKKALEFFASDSKKRPIIVAPTAGGKSVYIAHITHALKTGVLVLQPSKELLEQNYAKFVAYGGTASIFSASAGVKEVGDVTFATIGSVVNVPHLFAHVRHVLIDECHLVPPNNGKAKKGKNAKSSMYMTFLSQLPEGTKVLGLTATAFRLKTYRDLETNENYSKINLLPRELPKFFDDFLFVTQISELYEQKFLCPLFYIKLEWNNGMLRVNKTGAEFTEESVNKALHIQRVNERIPSIIEQSVASGRRHHLVFVNSIADAVALTRLVPDSAAIHSKMRAAERAEVLEAFRSGRVSTVFNVGVLTTGFDFPALDTVILARPTNSLSLYVQMLGRGIRLHPSKKECVIVDMCGNVKRFAPLEKLTYENRAGQGWMLTDGKRQLSGVRLDEPKSPKKQEPKQYGPRNLQLYHRAWG